MSIANPCPVRLLPSRSDRSAGLPARERPPAAVTGRPGAAAAAARVFALLLVLIAALPPLPRRATRRPVR